MTKPNLLALVCPNVFFTFATIIGLTVGGCALYYAITPKDVTYVDVLDHRNISTYAAHNTSWNNDDPENVDYVNKALPLLDKSSYGMTFGQLMDWTQAHELPNAFLPLQKGQSPANETTG